MTTISCVWVKGNVTYPVEYVARLAGMVKRWMDRPYRFVCLTDRPKEVPKGVDAVAVPCPRPLFGWWAKIELFSDRHGFSGRVLYLDLDTLIMASLAPILEFPSSFALIPHSGGFNGRDGLDVVKRFNSSVMVWDAGVNARLFDDWSPEVAHRLWGDQDWYGEQMPDAGVMPAAWFPRISEIEYGPVPAAAKVVLAKSPKNIEAAKRWPWVDLAWRAA